MKGRNQIHVSHLVFFLALACLMLAACGRNTAENQATAAKNMQLIMASLHSYGTHNGFGYPTTLAPVFRNRANTPNLLLDPRLEHTPMKMPAPDADLKQIAADIETHCDYYYAGSGQPMNLSAEAIIMYDKGQAGRTRLVCFSDSHIEPFAAGSPELIAAVKKANTVRVGSTKIPEDLNGPPQ